MWSGKRKMCVFFTKTAIGANHLKNGLPCQDHSASYHDEERTIVTVCDGHGGALYIRSGLRPDIFMDGGAQERARRGGTENVAGIVGFAKAMEMAMDGLEEKAAYISTMRDYLISQIEEKIPYVRLNGHRTQRLPNNVNFSFQYIEGESLLLSLDLKGIAASSGSACTSGSLDPSHVLLAIGLPHEIAHGSLRLTIGEENTMEDIDYVVDSLVEIVDRLRKMSPLYEEVLKKENK